MKKPTRTTMPQWWLLLLSTCLASLLLLLFLSFTATTKLIPASLTAGDGGGGGGFAEHPPRQPRLAYLISGSKGSSQQLRRVLRAVYHPLNVYLLHLDREVPEVERVELTRFVRSEAAFVRFDNVRVVGNADLVTYKGPTMVASTLHAVAILLKLGKPWDWFINLSSSDYPLMPQDDILHVFSYLPRYLNFIEHTSKMSWKLTHRARPIIVDPGLYGSNKSTVFWTKERRSVPASFKIFTGSAWVVLSRQFLEFCIWGYDNLPRTLLMYYTNYLSSPEGYFHSVICNSKDFQNSTINHDLHYILWHNPPRQHPMNLNTSHFDGMLSSGAPFARKFTRNTPVLDRIDRELLGKAGSKFTPGGWCTGSSRLGRDPCDSFGNPEAIKPTTNSKRLERLLLELLDPEKFRREQCS